MKKLISFLRYDLPYGVKNLIRFFPLIWRHRNWDYSYVENMMKFQLGLLREVLLVGNEVEESRLEKVKSIERCIEILKNRQEDNYAERCGYINDTVWDFVPVTDDYVELVRVGGSNSDEELKVIFKNARELEEKELNELYDLLKQSPGWWD